MQYKGSCVDLYDTAAETITGRSTFADWLIDYAGKRCDLKNYILEIAAGTGLISQKLLQRLNPRFMAHADISDETLTVCRDKLGNNGQLVTADFFHNPFPDGVFNTIFCVGGYRYVPEGRQADFLDEMRRLLNNGGSIVLAQFTPHVISIQGTRLSQMPQCALVVEQYDIVPAPSIGGMISPGNYHVSVMRKP